MKIRFIKPLLPLLLTVLCTSAMAKNTLDTAIPFNPQIKTGTLKNGLRYYVFRNGTPEKRVELRLVVKAGSVQEDDDQQGLAHFTEHLAFNGSQHFKKLELINYLQSIGLTFGADINAFTSADDTIYMLQIPTDRKENLDRAFDVLEDWAHGVTMEDASIDQERGVILEEARLNKGAQDRIYKTLYPLLNEGSKYANRMPIGKEDIIRSFQYDAVRRYYREWYRPDLMAVIAIGDLEPAKIVKTIEDHFGKLHNPAHERPHVSYPIPALKESKAVVITDAEASNRVLMVHYPSERAPGEVTQRDYRGLLMRELYMAMLNQRFADLTEQANPPYIFAANTRSVQTSGMRENILTIAPGPAGIKTALKVAIEEQERVRRFGFTSDELELAKKNRLRALQAAFKEHDKTDSAEHAAEMTRNFLIQEPVPGIHNEFAYNRDMMPGISLDEMNRYAAHETPSGSKNLVVYMGPKGNGDNTPSEHDLLAWTNEAETAILAPRAAQGVARKLIETLPEPGTIVKETYLADTGVTELSLSNGVVVRLKPTQYRNDQVLLGASRLGGYSRATPGDVLNARYAARMIQAMGLAGFTPGELGKVLAGKEVVVQTEGGPHVDSLSGRSGVEDVEAMLQLLYLSVTAPRTDPVLFQSAIAAAKEAASHLNASPDAIFADATQQAISADNPYALKTPKPADFDQLSLDKMIAIYRGRWGSARDMTFNIVGNFDIAAIKPLIARYIASLPVGEVDDQPSDHHAVLLTGVSTKTVYAGTEQKAVLSQVYNGDAHYSPEESAHFKLMLDVLNNRIIESLRERKSLIYGGGVSGGIDRIPDESYRINVNLPCGPENIDKVREAFLAELDQLKQNGPSAADLEKAKQGQLKTLERALKTNEAWLGLLQEASLFKQTLTAPTRMQELISGTSADDIKKAATRYFDMQNYLEIRLLPTTMQAAKQ